MAFEPSKLNYKLLIKNININKCNNITAFNFAISKHNSELLLSNINDENSGATSISNSNKGEKVLGRPIKISDLNNFNGNKNVYIKIDTEGYEMKILEAIKELFEKKIVQKLIIEIDKINLKKFSNTPEEVYDFLDKNGFQPTMGLRPGHYDEVFIKKN